jgi:hypothetical protein
VSEPVDSAGLLDGDGDGDGDGWTGADGLDETDGLVDGDGDPDGVVKAGVAAAEAAGFDGVGHCTADPCAADTVTEAAGADGLAVEAKLKDTEGTACAASCVVLRGRH